MRANDAAHEILDILADFRSSDDDKIVVVKQVIDPKALWREIELNIDVFSSETVFEGGFSLAPLVHSGWSLDDFRINWASFWLTR